MLVRAPDPFGSNSPVANAQLGNQVDIRSLQLLFRNSSSGQNFFTPLNSVAPGDSQSLPTVAPTWEIVGTGDFNKDQELDILWREKFSGQNTWWTMRNSQVTGSFGIAAVPDMTWQVVAVADFNRDTGLDILWRNRVTGANLLWFMDGDRFVNALPVMAVADLNWQVVGAGDINQDNQTDILWRNATTGEHLWWWMSGATCVGATSNLPKRVGAEHQIVAIADFNDDRSIDILWQNRAADGLQLWVMQQETVLAEYNIGTAGLGGQWEVVGLLSGTRSVAAEVGNSLATAEEQTYADFFRTQTVGGGDGSDIYRVAVGERGYLSAFLTGLTGDADVRIIADRNNNGAIDAGEVLAWQWERGVNPETIRRFVEPGWYFIEVLRPSSLLANGQVAGYTLSSNFRPAASNPEQFKLNINYGAGTELLTEAAKGAIASAAAYWEAVIPSRSAITNFQDLTINLTVENLNDGGILAQAGPNLLNNAGRLVITGGTSRINSQRVHELNGSLERLRLVMTHEFSHALGFGTIWRPFTFSNGVTVGRTYVNFSNQTYLAETYAGFAYGELLGSATPIAIPVDTVYAHWDEVRFDTELLTPFVEWGGAMPVSQLTIAALRDLGWNVNYGAAQPYDLPRFAAVQETVGWQRGNGLANLRSADGTGDDLTAIADPVPPAQAHGWTCGCSQHLSQNRRGLQWIGQSSLESSLLG
ncbi:MAG: FG-GAP-like repeat-containing protein [Synechococcales bacterium]|nr:FG-GAP-like repeat-containing protein [Synechococcales bacterium]